MNSNTINNMRAKKVYDFFRYHRIVNKFQIIEVVLRVIRVKKSLKGKLFEKNIGYSSIEALNLDMKDFSCDNDFFVRLDDLLDGWNEYDSITLLNLLDEGRNMNVPKVLLNIFSDHITSNVKSVLVTEIEKYGPALLDVIKKYPDVIFTLTFREKLWFDLFNESCYEYGNVKYIEGDIYTYEFTTEKFDLIVSVPTFGGRILIKGSEFISKEPDLIAAQNLLYHVNIEGELLIVLPAKITFASGSTAILRTYIENNYKIKEVSALPSGLFSPYTAVRTYLFAFSTGTTDDVILRQYESDKPLKKDSGCETLRITNEKLLFSDEFEKLSGWNIDMAFCEEDDDVKAYSESYVKKIHLREIAIAFRGKAVSTKSVNGNIGVINISNITDMGIDYDRLDFIDEEERNIAKYALMNDDVLVTARGTTIKIAVFKEQDYICIPSANINVIRPKNSLNGTYLKLFLESPVGMKLLKSLQRGETVTNINFKDMCELEVPLLPMEEQEKIVKEYSEGFNFYRQTIAAAEEGWKGLLLSLQAKLY